MPKVLNAGPVASRIAFFAPVSLLFFFAVMIILGMRRVAMFAVDGRLPGTRLVPTVDGHGSQGDVCVYPGLAEFAPDRARRWS